MSGLAHQPCLRIPRLRSTRTAISLISQAGKPWQHTASITGGVSEGPRKREVAGTRCVAGVQASVFPAGVEAW